MSLIIKDKIKQLMRGYPTVSDKYNVEGGIIEGTDGVNFGDMVVYGSTTGYYKKATALTDINEFAGFVLATNVKLEDTWGASGAPLLGPVTLPGEAFNLFMNGFIAIPLISTATLAQIKNGAKVAGCSCYGGRYDGRQNREGHNRGTARLRIYRRLRLSTAFQRAKAVAC